MSDHRDIIQPVHATVIIVDSVTTEQREAVHEVIKERAAAWWHHVPDVWIVLSDQTTADWKNLLKTELHAGPASLLTLRLPGDKGGRWSTFGFSRKPESTQWLKTNLTPWERP